MILLLLVFFEIIFETRSKSAIPVMIDNFFVRGIDFVAKAATLPVPPHLLPNEYVFELIRKGTIVHQLSKAEEERCSRHWALNRFSDFIPFLINRSRFESWVTVRSPLLGRDWHHYDKWTFVNCVLGSFFVV